MKTTLAVSLIGLVSVVACGRSEPTPVPTTPSAAEVVVATPDAAAAPIEDVAAAAPEVVVEVAAAPRSGRADLATCKANGDVATCLAAGDAYRSVSGAIASEAYTIACAKDNREACVAVAAEQRDLIGTHGGTIYSSEPLRFDGVASNSRACELGDWVACSWLADRNRAVACTHGATTEPLEAPNAELREKFDVLTVAKAELACDAGEIKACELVAWRSLEGCGRTQDVPHALARLGLVLAAAKCSAEDLNGCREVRYRCDWARDALPGAVTTATAPVAVVAARASSVLPPWKGYRFTASQLVDGEITTSWQPLDKKRGGVGQWFELRLRGPTHVVAIEIANGLQKVDALGDLFIKNNRITHGTIELDDGARLPFEVAVDQRGFVTVPVGGTSSFVRVVVDGVKRGSEWNDLAVSEVRVLGRAVSTTGAGLPDLCTRPAAIADEVCRAGDIKGCEMVIERAEGEAKKAAHEAASKLATRVCEADDKGAAACVTAATHALAIDPAATTARPFFVRACKLGDESACGALGCHQKEGDEDAIDGNAFDDRFKRADAAECQAFCDAGDDASCLALGGAVAYDVAGLDFASPFVVKVTARTVESCTTAAECEGIATGFEPDPNERAPLDLVSFVRGLAAYERACELGSVTACSSAMWKVALWADSSARVNSNGKRACELGDIDACETVMQRGVDVGDAFERAYASAVKACEGGDPAPCHAAIESSKRHRARLVAYATKTQGPDPEAESERLTTLRRDQLVRACEGGDRNACGEGAARGQGVAPDPVLTKRQLALAVGSCLDDAQRDSKDLHTRLPRGGLCAPLCDVAVSLGMGDLNLGAAVPTNESFAPLAELAPELTPTLLLDLCIEVQLEDPCSCGCC